MSELALIFYKHIKHNSRCMVCSSNEHLNFHHVKPADKLSEIFKVTNMGDLDMTIAEMQKTIPLCEFDHRRVHTGRLNGWLDGHFDNGKPSSAHLAMQYTPYITWLAKRKPHIVVDFYRDYVDKNHRALMGVFADAARPETNRRASDKLVIHNYQAANDPQLPLIA